MTPGEAIDIIENKIQIDVSLCTKEEVEQYQEALYMAIAALRGPTRERGELERGGKERHAYWYDVGAGGGYCSACRYKAKDRGRYCQHCGARMDAKKGE